MAEEAEWYWVAFVAGIGTRSSKGQQDTGRLLYELYVRI